MIKTDRFLNSHGFLKGEPTLKAVPGVELQRVP